MFNKKSFLIISVLKGASAALQLLFTLLIVKYLDAPDSAALFWIISLTFILAGFSKGGMDLSVLNFYSKHQGRGKTVQKALKISMTLGTASAIIAYLAANQFKENDYSLLVLFATPFISSCFVLAFYFQSRKYLSSQQLVSGILPFGMCSLLFVCFDEVIPIELIIVFSWLTTFFIFAARYKHLKFVSQPMDTRLLVFGRTYWGVGSLSMLMSWLPIFIAGFYVSDNLLEVLSFALRLGLAMTFMLTVVNAMFGKDLVGLLTQQKYSSLRSFYIRVTAICCVFGLIFWLICYLFVDEIFFSLSLASDYQFLLLVILSFQFIPIVMGPNGMLLNLTKNQGIVLKGSLLSIVTLIILMPGLYFLYGEAGVVASIGVMTLVANSYGLPKVLSILSSK